jgi:hypothetical protein
MCPCVFQHSFMLDFSGNDRWNALYRALYRFAILFSSPFQPPFLPVTEVVAMKAILLAVAILFLSCVAAINSGIFEDDHQTISQAPGVEVRDFVKRDAPVVPTPSRRLTNAEGLRRGLSPLPPARRSGSR